MAGPLACGCPPRPLPEFFTLWSLLLVLAAPLTRRLVDLLAITLVTAVGGAYLTYVHPRQFFVRLSRTTVLHLCGWPMHLGDVLLHAVPLAIVAFLYGRYYLRVARVLPLVGAAAVLLTYLWLVDVRQVYCIGDGDVVAICVACAVLFALLRLAAR